MDTSTACSALASGKCLEIQYDGFVHTVEVHAVGISTAGNYVMRVWQVSGGSVSNETEGWKLLRLDETLGMGLTDMASQAPRVGYKRGDKGMTDIISEL